MEEKSIIHNNQFEISLSDWRLRHNLYQTSRNYRQLENRINILELQKKKKLKDIENKLNSHKKSVENKIYKHQLKTAINVWTQNQNQIENSNSRMFQVIKESRKQNIKKKQQEMLETKHKMFQEIKKHRKQNQQIIGVKKLENLQEKISKRNRVRLIEIGCKENIEGFWNSRLENFQEDKKLEISRKIMEQERGLNKLEKLEKSQESLLQEIKRAEYIEKDLKSLISQERTMKGSQLNNLYISKVADTKTE